MNVFSSRGEDPLRRLSPRSSRAKCPELRVKPHAGRDEKSSVSPPARIGRATAVVAAGQALNGVSLFARNVVIARLISPEDFGIAATFAMAVSLLEMMSNLGVDRLIVQAPDGDDPGLQGAAQVVEVFRGVVTALLLFAIAGLAARLLGVPAAQDAFRWLALIPLIRGFIHLDMKREQRHMNFRPFVLVDAGSGLLATLAALPLGLWLGDYRVALWVLVAHSCLLVLGSHGVASRPYRLAWEPRFGRRILRFGAPLLASGALLYVIFQGDRFLIAGADRLFGREIFTLADLGVWSVAFALTRQPAVLLTNLGARILLPSLSRVREDAEAFRRTYATAIELAILVGALFGIGVILAGGAVLSFFYSAKYAAAAAFIGWLGALQAVRIPRLVPTQASISAAETLTPMYANMIRASALIAMFVAVWAGGGFVALAVCGLGGEIAALLFTVLRLRGRLELPLGLSLGPALLGAAALLSAAALAQVGGPFPLAQGVGFAALLGLAWIGVFVLCFGRLRGLAGHFLPVLLPPSPAAKPPLQSDQPTSSRPRKAASS